MPVCLGGLYLPTSKWRGLTFPWIAHLQIFHRMFDFYGLVKLESWKSLCVAVGKLSKSWNRADSESRISSNIIQDSRKCRPKVSTCRGPHAAPSRHGIISTLSTAPRPLFPQSRIVTRLYSPFRRDESTPGISRLETNKSNRIASPARVWLPHPLLDRGGGGGSF